MSYEIITVSWNPEQTRIWRHWVNKNCPTAKVYTIPDRKPFRRCWSGGKIDCWLYGFEGKRVIYLDTDTIVTTDLEPVFDMMGDAKIAVSLELKQDRLKRKFGPVVEQFRERGPFRIHNPPNISSGMIALKDYDPELLYGMWADIMNDALFIEELMGHYTSEEYAIALAVARMFRIKDVWPLPGHVHGNIHHGNKQFGGTKRPMVIHYHRPAWLVRHHLEEYLNVGDDNSIRRGQKVVSGVQPSDGTAAK